MLRTKQTKNLWIKRDEINKIINFLSVPDVKFCNFGEERFQGREDKQPEKF